MLKLIWPSLMLIYCGIGRSSTVGRKADDTNPVIVCKNKKIYSFVRDGKTYDGASIHNSCGNTPCSLSNFDGKDTDEIYKLLQECCVFKIFPKLEYWIGRGRCQTLTINDNRITIHPRACSERYAALYEYTVVSIPNGQPPCTRAGSLFPTAFISPETRFYPAIPISTKTSLFPIPSMMTVSSSLFPTSSMSSIVSSSLFPTSSMSSTISSSLFPTSSMSLTISNSLFLTPSMSSPISSSLFPTSSMSSTESSSLFPLSSMSLTTSSSLFTTSSMSSTTSSSLFPTFSMSSTISSSLFPSSSMSSTISSSFFPSSPMSSTTSSSLFPTSSMSSTISSSLFPSSSMSSTISSSFIPSSSVSSTTSSSLLPTSSMSSTTSSSLFPTSSMSLTISSSIFPTSSMSSTTSSSLFPTSSNSWTRVYTTVSVTSTTMTATSHTHKMPATDYPGANGNGPNNKELLFGWRTLGNREYYINKDQLPYKQAEDVCKQEQDADLIWCVSTDCFPGLVRDMHLETGLYWIGGATMDIDRNGEALLLNVSYFGGNLDVLVTTSSLEMSHYSLCSRAANVTGVIDKPEFVKLLKDMTVETKKTSKARRKLMSVDTSDLSAKIVGIGLGVVILSCIFGSIILMDIPKLFRCCRCGGAKRFVRGKREKHAVMVIHQ